MTNIAAPARPDDAARDDVTEIPFNHHDRDVMQNPYALFDQVRSRCPLGHSSELGGFYFATTHEGVKRSFAEFRSFASGQGTALPPQPLPLLPVDLDPPSHTAWRRVLNRFFTETAAQADAERIQGIADRLIDSFIERGTVDAVNELTRPFLARSMLPVIGVPATDEVEIGDKLMWMVHNRTSDFDGYIKKYMEVGEYLTNLVRERRSSPRRDDLVQSLVEEDFDGRKLSDVEGYQVLLLTLFGALDSTSSAMSGSLYHLALVPADKQRLMSSDVPWATAIEEFLRFTTPIQALRRTVVREVELDGGKLQPGDFILALNGAANRDPVKFPEPDRCLIDRDARDHMTFGSGAHVCIGRHFARLMLRTCIETTLRRVPDFTVADDFRPEYTASEARALTRLPLSFTPGVRLTPG